MTVEALSLAVVASWNRSDWAAYRGVADPDLTYEELASGRRLDGVAAVLGVWRRARAAMPDAHAHVLDVTVGADTALVSLLWSATHSGPLHTPEGVESPSYARLRLADAVTFTWRHGRLAAERHRLGFLSLLEPVVAHATRQVSAGAGCGGRLRSCPDSPPDVPAV